MALTNRVEKGSPLTFQELDGNFDYLNIISTGNTQALTTKADIVNGVILIDQLPETSLGDWFSDTDSDTLVDSINETKLTSFIKNLVLNDSTILAYIQANASGGLTRLTSPVLSLTGSGNTTLSFSWTSSVNAEQYNLELLIGSTWTSQVTQLTLSYTITGLTLGTSYQVRVTAKDSDLTYADSLPSNIITTSTTGGSSGAVTPLVFTTLTPSEDIVYNSGANSYKTNYVDGGEGFGNILSNAGKKADPATDGVALYLSATNSFKSAFGFGNTTTSTGKDSMKVALQFSGSQYRDLFAIDDTQTIDLSQYADLNTDYRVIRISGIFYLQKSTDNWVTSAPVYTYGYNSTGVTLYPFADIRIDSENNAIVVNPRQINLTNV